MVHSFTDKENREWKVSLNGYQLKYLKQRINFDARDPDSIIRAADDPALLCDVLYLLCEDQCQAANVTDRQFGEALVGDVIDAAADAYIQETIDFFPQRQRQTLTMIVSKIKSAQSRVKALAEEKVNSPAMDQMIDKMLSEASQRADDLLAGKGIGNSSGSAPGLPGSIRSPVPFVNSSGLEGGMSMRPGSGQPNSAQS